MNPIKALADYFKIKTQNIVRPGIDIEGKNYDDKMNTLDVFGDTITIRADTDIPENVSKILEDPLQNLLDPTKENATNLSRFLGRLQDDVTDDPVKSQVFFRELNNLAGSSSSQNQFAKINVEEIVMNASEKDIEESLMAVFRYKETGKISTKNLVLNMANAINVFNDFNTLLQRTASATDVEQKTRLTKNTVARFVMLKEMGDVVNTELSLAGQKLAMAQHTKKVFTLDYDTTLRNLLDLDLNFTNMNQETLQTISRMFMNFKAGEMVRVVDQMDPQWWQRITDAGKNGVKFAYDAVMELYYNALLSGGPTHLVNTLGVKLHMMKDQADTYLAAGIGNVRQKAMSVFGQDVSQYDRHTFKMVNGRAAAQANSVKDAAKLFFKMMATGEGPDSVTKFDFKKDPVIKAPGAAGTDNMLDIFDQLSNGNYVHAAMNMLGVSARISTRFMIAEDTFFKYIAKRAFLYEEAFKRAGTVFEHDVRNGMSAYQAEVKMESKILEMMAAPTSHFSPNTLTRADEHARKMTFQQELGPFERSLANVFKLPGLNFLAPFVKTPLNVGKTTLDNSFNIFPVVDALSRGQGKEFDKALAKMVSGQFIVWSTVMLASGMFGDQVKIVGGPHPDKKVRDYLRSQGIQNYSAGFKQDDGSYKYVPFTRLDPISGLLAMSADYVQMSEYMDAEELDKLAQILTLSIANYVGDQPFLQGVSDFNNVVLQGGKGDRWAKFFGQKAAQIKGTTESVLNPFGIPFGNYVAKYGRDSELPQPLGSFVRNLAPSSSWQRRMAILDDPTIKDTTYDYSVIQRYEMHPFFRYYYDEIDKIRANNPALNDSFEMRKGMFYKDRGAKEHIFGGYEHILSPWNITTSKRDRVEEELYQLAISSDGYDKNLAPSWNVKEIDGIQLNKEQKDRFNYLWSEMDDLGYVDGESGYRKENNLKGTLLNEINSSEYKSLDNVGKSLALNTIFNERRQRAVERLTNNETMFPELYKLFEIVREEKRVKKMRQNLIDQFGGSAE